MNGKNEKNEWSHRIVVARDFLQLTAIPDSVTIDCPASTTVNNFVKCTLVPLKNNVPVYAISSEVSRLVSVRDVSQNSHGNLNLTESPTGPSYNLEFYADSLGGWRVANSSYTTTIIVSGTEVYFCVMSC